MNNSLNRWDIAPACLLCFGILFITFPALADPCGAENAQYQWGEIGAKCCPGNFPQDQGNGNFICKKSQGWGQDKLFNKAALVPTQDQFFSALEKFKSAPAIGSEQAPVSIHVFQDYTCGMCRYAYNEILKPLLSDYVSSNKVRLVFVDFPLGFMPESVTLAKVGLCAQQQGKFNDFLSAINQEADSKDARTPAMLIKNAGLDPTSAQNCLDDAVTELQVRQSYIAGQELGVNGTPHFFIQGLSSPGARDYEGFRNLVEEALSKPIKGIEEST